MSHTVIKVGGDIVRSPSLAPLCSDIAAMSKSGDLFTFVHGGGPQATETQKALGQTPNIVAGRRITDSDALEVMKMVVGGRINADLCSALIAAGATPIGLHGASSHAIRAVKRPPRVVAGGGDQPIDFGFVGDVVGINASLLKLLQGADYIPVLSCLGADQTGQLYNINADVVANQVAKHLGAEHLILVTSAPGVLRDISDKESRIPILRCSEIEDAIADGTVQGGMIPKLMESKRVLETGCISAIHIVGNLQAGDCKQALQDPGSVGTALLP